MSRPEEARNPAQNTTAEWYRSFTAELASRGLPSSEVERTAASTRAEAEAAGVAEGSGTGPSLGACADTITIPTAQTPDGAAP